MKATPNDWLIVESGHLGAPRRRALVLEVRGPDGDPPFYVEWSDTGRRSLVFPGPDARIEHPSE